MRYNNPEFCTVSIKSMVVYDESTPQISLGSHYVDLDTIRSASDIEAVDIRYENLGKNDLVIDRIWTESKFCTFTLTKETVGSEKVDIIRAQFDFRQMPRGRFSVKARIESNDPGMYTVFQIEGVYWP